MKQPFDEHLFMLQGKLNAAKSAKEAALEILKAEPESWHRAYLRDKVQRCAEREHECSELLRYYQATGDKEHYKKHMEAKMQLFIARQRRRNDGTE